MLTRDQILGAPDLRPTEFPVPEWGGTVFLRSLTAGERERWEGMSDGNKSRHEIRAAMLAVAICDEAGRSLFTEADVAALSAKSAAPIVRLFEAAFGLSKVSKADVEALEKNSATSPSGGSSSDSPAI